ncbi:acetyl-CoA carboxylase biotin carboxylase subunit [Oceanospirillum linum]|uniref:Biotin carboxylase n=1 Tax=Oceanospirillum linum TaxID=966 RepID=A0A1T1HCD6_OCELI|nr:acetyl-CoA carboxylase biotin carboxylase subunit [Oceanospirillum linum]OOV87538.1 acetyl-CoA carboxylase biotin carboxylase subunit [Oceanospirillum linum]SEF91069.1 3-methylcrotonoyl-CoA carboxylase, alpha subunit [Oleiphilus messinensis]SMP13183.1 3-methylcrotonoyl-CoA carboxylase, alpha subunit [Oceanospirillum linum]
MFNKILIANRGEIACRVIRTAHQMGIRCVAVYSEADADAMHVAMADEAVCVGPAASKDSYLKMDTILQVAKDTGAQAIHPGYGFLSENAPFVQKCQEAGVVFIGPPADAIKAMGSKSAAKRIMEDAKVPLVPGYHGDDQDPALLKKHSDEMGYPVLLKATAGGGGKGMRVVWSADEFTGALDAAKREAMNGFADDTMLVEKYLTKPRHVEIQVFCDQHGNSVYLAERDCSVQRRHQKVVEEAPAPGMSDELRTAMGEAAVRAAEAIGYVGAGTVEFLLDEDGSFYFMEMNTRLQVEHPVTELITGQDLVEWQLAVASGQTLPISQDDVQINGHAVEVRIYAEDPDNDFLPATGKLEYLRTPEENRYVRVDTGVREGDEVSIYYDPMIAKLIVWDENRERAMQRMSQALTEYRIAGMKTNTHFLKRLIDNPAFRNAELDTGFIEKHETDLFESSATYQQSGSQSANPLAMATLYTLLKQQQNRKQEAIHSHDETSPWHQFSGWRLNEDPTHVVRFTQTLAQKEGDDEQIEHEITVNWLKRGYRLTLDGHIVIADGTLSDDRLQASLNGHSRNAFVAELNGHITVFTDQGAFEYQWQRPDLDSHDFEDDSPSLTAPMNGSIVAVLVEPGQQVTKGTAMVIMEAMKMEHTITASVDGTVTEIFFQPGDLVEGGADLVAFEAEEA